MAERVRRSHRAAARSGLIGLAVLCIGAAKGQQQPSEHQGHASGSGGVAQQATPLSRPQLSQHHPNAETRRADWLGIPYDGWVAIFTFTLTISTVWLGWTTRKLWLGTERQAADWKRSVEAAIKSADAHARQAHLSEVALIQANRAYVDILEFCNDWIIETNTEDSAVVRKLHVFVRFKNTGNTPATQLLVAIGVFKSETATNPEGGFNMPDGLADSYVAPGTMQSTQDVYFSEDDVLSVAGGKRRIWLLILIRYRDVFEGTPIRHLQVCSEMSFIGPPEQCWDPNTPNPPDFLRWQPYGPMMSAS